MDPMSQISKALEVTHAFCRLASNALSDGELPKTMAETMSTAAKDASSSLAELLHGDGQKTSAQRTQAIKRTQVDLEILGDLAELALQYDLTRKNAMHLARALRYTADRTLDALKLLERDIRADPAR
jgi:hypothetical protein